MGAGAEVLDEFHTRAMRAVEWGARGGRVPRGVPR